MPLTSRLFGQTGRNATRIGFGAWAIGGTWGEVTEADAKATLHAALDAGMTFIDTADVYGDGRSERIIRDVLKDRPGERPFVATKAGRRSSPHDVDSYNHGTLERYVDRSLTNLGVERLDLLQLHCPPTAVFYRPEVFGALDQLVKAGKLANYGVSVEKVEEGLRAVATPGVASVQIIYNIFRQRPADLFMQEAARHGVAVIARVPLASGMLTGKMTADSTFASDDHRSFNREGAAFDMGETFSGVPYDIALEAVEAIRPWVPRGTGMAQFALRWILMEDAVSVVIPGARNPSQAGSNAEADRLEPLPPEAMAAMRKIYESRIKPFVHQRW